MSFLGGPARLAARSDSVVAKTCEPERGSLHPFDQIVHGLLRTVADVGLVPGHDLMFPTLQSAAERPYFNWLIGVGEFAGQGLCPFHGQVRVGVVIDIADGL